MFGIGKNSDKLLMREMAREYFHSHPLSLIIGHLDNILDNKKDKIRVISHPQKHTLYFHYRVN